MADYAAFGFSLHEIAVKTHLAQRAFFGIALKNDPKWLSWYVYEQSKLNYCLEDFAFASTADSVTKIGDTIAATGYSFSYDPQINVNAFANQGPSTTGTSSAATLTVIENKDKTLTCRVSITRKAGAIANLHFRLTNPGTARNLIPNKSGFARLIFTEDLSKMSLKNALILGPFAKHSWLKDPYAPML